MEMPRALLLEGVGGLGVDVEDEDGFWRWRNSEDMMQVMWFIEMGMGD